MEPNEQDDDGDTNTRSDDEIAADREREEREYLEGIEYDRQEERGLDRWRGLDD